MRKSGDSWPDLAHHIVRISSIWPCMADSGIDIIAKNIIYFACRNTLDQKGQLVASLPTAYRHPVSVHHPVPLQPQILAENEEAGRLGEGEKGKGKCQDNMYICIMYIMHQTKIPRYNAALPRCRWSRVWVASAAKAYHVSKNALGML